MEKSIFRQSALERLSTPEQLDQAMRITSPAAWLALAAFAALIAGGLIWSFIGTVPEKVSGKGILISPGGVLDVIASSQGRVQQFLVQPGDWIEGGKVIAYIAQPDIENELEVAKAELTEAKAEYQKLLEFQKRDIAFQRRYLDQKRQALVRQMGATEERLKWLREREDLEAQLHAKGLVQRQRIVNTKIELNNALGESQRVQNDLRQVDLDESTLTITREKERILQEAKVSASERKVETLKDKLLRNSEVVSPYTGHIVEFKVNAGEVVQPGRALFSMLPQDHLIAVNGKTVRHPANLVAKLYVRPEDGKKIRAGMMAQIAPSTVKREEYGYIEANVIQVATIPSSEEGILRVLKNKQLVQELSGGGAPLEVTVELKLDPASNNGYRWSSSAGPDAELNPGTLAEGTITVREIHLISLAIPALEHLFERPVS